MMSIKNPATEYQSRSKLKLSEIERIIRQQKMIVPCPSRQTLIGLCENGTFESVGKDANGFPAPTSLGWLVFADSFWRWARALDGVAV